ncbi:MAG: complex I subunit 1/NuoH family protein [Leadbetterella sp.]
MWIPLLVFLIVVGANVIISVYVERKLSAFIQDRLGPMEVGKWGIFQLIADLVKLFQKEDIIPSVAEKRAFKWAPYLIFASIFAGFALIPIGPLAQGSYISTGLMVIMGVISLDVLGIILAGWGSNNKYSLLGAMRSISQILAYEIPMGICLICVSVVAGTLNLQEIAHQQGILASESIPFLGIKSLGLDANALGGFLAWNIFNSPLLFIIFIIYFISALAESNRAPFDLPEAESELVAGYHTEYSGFRWAILFLAEYGMMLLLCLLGVVLFLGAWNTPFPNIGSFKLAQMTTGDPQGISAWIWGGIWLFTKAYFLMLIMMWVRWTLPRLRIDQLIYFCWKVLTPFALVFLIGICFWKAFLTL